MTTVGGHSFRLERTSFKSQDLVYEEPGRRLVVYLEMSGVPRFDWVGCDVDFQRWSEPAGEPIEPAKQAEILQRLAEWSVAQGIRIDIGPPIDLEVFFAEQQAAGHRIERRPDGTVAVHPVNHGFWTRLVGLSRDMLKSWGVIGLVASLLAVLVVGGADAAQRCRGKHWVGAWGVGERLVRLEQAVEPFGR